MARSFAQRDAQLKAMESARGAAAKRAEAKRHAEREQAELERKTAEHVANGHERSWSNWEYSSDYTTESRVCRVCGATETRPLVL